MEELKLGSWREFQSLSCSAFRRSRFGDYGMAISTQQHAYQCDQCGAPEIVAVLILYQQGTRSFSGTFSHGVSQSYSAKAVAPPPRRGYVRPVLLWGFAMYFFLFWGGAGLRGMLEHVEGSAGSRLPVIILLAMGIACLIGLILNLIRNTRYNREVYPQLQWDWTHTYMCNRCGSFRLIR